MLSQSNNAGPCKDYCEELCDDGNKCTTNHNIIGESCQCLDPPTPVDCNDNDPGTLDACDPSVGCVHKPILDEPCPLGYQKDTTGSCIDVDECALTYLELCEPASSFCVNDPGSYHCECKAGYEKDGNGVCVDINECADGKNGGCNPETEECVNDLGSHHCQCGDGYYRKKGVCVDFGKEKLFLFPSTLQVSVSS